MCQEKDAVQKGEELTIPSQSLTARGGMERTRRERSEQGVKEGRENSILNLYGKLIVINTSCPLHKAEVRQLMMVCRINFRDRKLFSLPSSLFHSFIAPFSLLAPSIPALLPRDCFNFEMELSAPRKRRRNRCDVWCWCEVGNLQIFLIVSLLSSCLLKSTWFPGPFEQFHPARDLGQQWRFSLG